MLEYIALILSGVLCYLYLKKKSPLDALPGPKPSFLVGNAFQLSGTSDQSYIVLHKLAKKFGGIFKIRLFSTPVVVVSDSELIHTMLVKKSSDFAGRPLTYRLLELTDGSGGVTFSDDSPEHKNRRKAIAIFLKQFGDGIQKIEDITQDAINDMIKKLQKNNSEPFDLRHLIFHCITDITCILITGETVSSENISGIMDCIDDASEAMDVSGSGTLLDMFPLLRFFGNKCYKQLQSAKSLNDDYIRKWIEDKPTYGFLGSLNAMTEEELKRHFLDEMRCKLTTTWDFLTAGIYTTSTTMTTLINVLCHYPLVQKKLREEVMEVIGTARHPTMKDRENMPYMRATILEIGRFASILPAGLPRKAMKDTSLGDYSIPKGTAVWANLYTLHHNEDLWDKPYEFCPERFLDENGQVVPVDHPSRKNLMPFSAGNRVCVGEVFALLRLFLITSCIVQNFTILPETTLEKQPPCDPRSMIFGIVTRSPPFKVRFVPLTE